MAGQSTFSKEQITTLLASAKEPSQDSQEIITLLGFIENKESYELAISRISQIPQEEYPSIVHAVYYLIWSTPVFRKQVALIDFILSSTPAIFHALLFHHIALKFEQIATDRKDKFFYFLKKTFPIMSFAYILELENVEVLDFILQKIDSKSAVSDWDDALFINFVSTCKPFLLGSIQGIKIEEELVRKSMKNVTNPRNREALYKLFK